MRTQRIHHRERLKKSRAMYWRGNASEITKQGFVVETPKPCSCWMCGNPRKFFKELTLQEKSDLETDRKWEVS